MLGGLLAMYAGNSSLRADVGKSATHPHLEGAQASLLDIRHLGVNPMLVLAVHSALIVL